MLRALPRKTSASFLLKYSAALPSAIVLIFLLSWIAPPCSAQTQQAAIDQLIAKSLSDIRKQKSVAVFNFVGPNDRVTVLGRALAGDFSSKLAANGGKLVVVEGSTIDQAILSRALTPEVVRDPNVASWIAESIHVKSIVFGRLSQDQQQLSIDIDVFGVEKRNFLKSFHATMDATESVRADLGQTIQTHPPVSRRDTHASGTKGYTTPSCVYCPQPSYSREGLKRRTQGTVLLSIIVGPDEHAHDILVLKPLPDGLSENAVEAVKSWRFKPAVGPDGAPAAVIVDAEVTFHLY